MHHAYSGKVKVPEDTSLTLIKSIEKVAQESKLLNVPLI